jgi:hypothetical protein
MMKRCIIPVLLLTLVGAGPAVAGDDARGLLQKSVEACGGMDAMGAWETMIRTGELTVHWPGWGSPRAKCTLRVKRPDKLVLDQDFSAYDHPFFFTYYYNGGEVWAMVNLGVRQSPRYTDAMTRAMKNAGGMHYYMSECDTFFLAGPVPDDSLVTGASVTRVGIVDEGDTVMVDIDKETHLPVRLLRENGAEQSLFADYREVGGIKVPFEMTVYQNGAVSAEYVWGRIVFDEPIDDADFEEYRPEPQASG